MRSLAASKSPRATALPASFAHASRLDAFEALKIRAALYQDVLQVHVQDLEKALADLTHSVETLLNERAVA